MNEMLVDILLSVEEEEPIDMEIETPSGESNDYNNLVNKPRLNGKTIVGDVEEEDPTVPSWAKQERKPSYSAGEVEAVPEDNNMSLQEIDELFNSVFNN